jgi:Zn-finger nucleic acid-binding protein
MVCPICEVELKATQRLGVTIDYCPQCRGVWLDRGELDKIIQRTMALAMPFPVGTENQKHDYMVDFDFDNRELAFQVPNRETTFNSKWSKSELGDSFG